MGLDAGCTITDARVLFFCSRFLPAVAGPEPPVGESGSAKECVGVIKVD